MEEFNHFENREPGEQESEQEIVWRKKLEELESITDALDTPIDKNIKEAVAAMQLNGFHTSASCEGHAGIGYPAPWVEVEAPNKPEERFVNEKEINEQVARKYGVTIEELKREINQEASGEAFDEASKNEETQEYQAWLKENERLLKKMQDILNEFYEDRDVPNDVRLVLQNYYPVAFRVHNGGEEYKKSYEDWRDDIDTSITEEEMHALEDRIVRRRQEMDEFTKFLKNKYFSEKQQ